LSELGFAENARPTISEEVTKKKDNKAKVKTSRLREKKKKPQKKDHTGNCVGIPQSIPGN